MSRVLQAQPTKGAFLLLLLYLIFLFPFLFSLSSCYFNINVYLYFLGAGYCLKCMYVKNNNYKQEFHFMAAIKTNNNVAINYYFSHSSCN